MFKDIHYECYKLSSLDISKRADELSKNTEGCSVVAIGGFPISLKTEGYFWHGNLVTAEVVKHKILEALGTSGMLTYMNTANMSLEQMGNVCAEKGHLWAYHWMTLSILVSGYGAEVEMAFLRDSTFRMSWPARSAPGTAVIANGTLKEWLKFVRNKDSADFPAGVRQVLTAVHSILEKILP